MQTFSFQCTFDMTETTMAVTHRCIIVKVEEAVWYLKPSFTKKRLSRHVYSWNLLIRCRIVWNDAFLLGYTMMLKGHLHTIYDILFRPILQKNKGVVVSKIYVKHLVVAKKEKKVNIYKKKINEFLVFFSEWMHKSQHTVYSCSKLCCTVRG